jgi:hypothetical protein
MFSTPKPMSELLFQDHIHNHSPFGGRVRPVDNANPRVEVIERVQPTIQERLMNLVIEDAELKRRRREIVGPLADLTMKAEELIAEVEKNRTQTLEDNLEQIRSAGRQQLEIIEALEADHQRKMFDFMNLREQHGALSEQIADRKRARLPRFASKQDRQAHQRRIDNLQKQLRSLTDEVATAGQEQQRTFEDLEAAQAAMRKISDAEIRCSGALSGQNFVDPELGLPVKATV